MLLRTQVTVLVRVRSAHLRVNLRSRRRRGGVGFRRRRGLEYSPRQIPVWAKLPQATVLGAPLPAARERTRRGVDGIRTWLRSDLERFPTGFRRQRALGTS